MARACGPTTVYAQKTRIVFMRRVRYLSVYTHRHWLEAGIWLKRRGARHAALHRVEDYQTLGCVYYLKLTRLDQLDAGLGTLLREAYAVGRQDAP